MAIKAIFILFRPYNLSCDHDPISWDKLLEMLVALVNCILGLTLDLYHLNIGIPPDFLAKVCTMIPTTWEYIGTHSSFAEQKYSLESLTT